MSKRAFAIFIVSLSVVGCQTTTGDGIKQSMGTILGGVAGAVAGAQVGKGSGRVAAGAAGALLGAFVGNQIGLSLDRADQLAMQKTTNLALETSKSGTAVAWQNPDTGNRGTAQKQLKLTAEHAESQTVAGKSFGDALHCPY